MNVITEANRIKDRLCACKTPDEIETVANQERATVQAMAKATDGKALATHIINLKAYKLRGMQ